MLKTHHGHISFSNLTVAEDLSWLHVAHCKWIVLVLLYFNLSVDSQHFFVKCMFLQQTSPRDKGQYHNNQLRSHVHLIRTFVHQEMLSSFYHCSFVSRAVISV